MKENVVFTSTLDGQIELTVTRTGPYRGELTISEADQVLHRQDVGLMYDAQFGPDVIDVIEWKRIAIDFVDGHKSSCN